MARTPNPTIEEYRVMAPFSGGRVSIALQEIERRLEENLPAIIDDVNDREGYTTDDVKIRKPDFYAGAPIGEDDGNLNGILIGGAKELELEGNRHFKSVIQVSIYSIDQRIETREQYWRSWDRVDLIYRALHPFLGGCIDENDRVCWRSLVPTSGGWENEDWDIYGGSYAFFNMTCDPSQNGWA